MTDFDVYAVGLLRDLRTFRASRKWHVLRRSISYVRHHLRDRDWRAVRNHFNGWLAEPIGLPDEAWRCCGRGWTREGAKRNFWRRNKRWLKAAGLQP